MKTTRNYLAASILLLGLLFVYIPIRYQTPYPRDIGPQFDPHIRKTYINLLDQHQPDVLLFGDSMLAPAVNEAAVDERLGQKTALVSMPGTASTIWYLMIKNNIVVAEHKPKYLVVFFRDSMMTVPGYRVSGRYFEQIDEFAAPSDTLLIQRAYINQMTPIEKIFEAYVPFYGSRWTIRRSIDRHVRYSLPKTLIGCDPACTDYSMESVFDTSNLDINSLSDAIAASDEYIYTDTALDFDEQIDQSFLPEVIRLCKENDINLILVRMPILRFMEPGSQPKGLKAYTENLAGYLEQNGIPYIDFDDKELKSGFFADSLHLNQQGEIIFTEKLIRALETIIQ